MYGGVYKSRILIKEKLEDFLQHFSGDLLWEEYVSSNFGDFVLTFVWGLLGEVVGDFVGEVFWEVC